MTQLRGFFDFHVHFTPAQYIPVCKHFTDVPTHSRWLKVATKQKCICHSSFLSPFVIIFYLGAKNHNSICTHSLPVLFLFSCVRLCAVCCALCWRRFHCLWLRALCRACCCVGAVIAPLPRPPPPNFLSRTSPPTTRHRSLLRDMLSGTQKQIAQPPRRKKRRKHIKPDRKPNCFANPVSKQSNCRNTSLPKMFSDIKCCHTALPTNVPELDVRHLAVGVQPNMSNKIVDIVGTFAHEELRHTTRVVAKFVFLFEKSASLRYVR